MDAGIAALAPMLDAASSGEPVAETAQVSGPLGHNSSLPADVNRDGMVSPLDALIVINQLNGAVVTSADEPMDIDVSGDGFVSPIDALIVFNHLNNAGDPEPALVPQSAWQNPVDPLDVNGDGFVSAVDALMLINSLQTEGPRALPDTSVPSPPFFDVNGDWRVSEADVDPVMSHLRTLWADFA